MGLLDKLEFVSKTSASKAKSATEQLKQGIQNHLDVASGKTVLGSKKGVFKSWFKDGLCNVKVGVHSLFEGTKGFKYATGQEKATLEMLSKALDGGELKSRLEEIDMKNEEARKARINAKGKKK
jgi:hypothetical protein